MQRFHLRISDKTNFRRLSDTIKLGRKTRPMWSRYEILLARVSRELFYTRKQIVHSWKVEIQFGLVRHLIVESSCQLFISNVNCQSNEMPVCQLQKATSPCERAVNAWKPKRVCKHAVGYKQLTFWSGRSHLAAASCRIETLVSSNPPPWSNQVDKERRATHRVGQVIVSVGRETGASCPGLINRNLQD